VIDEIATNVAIPRKIPRPVKTARDLRRSRFFHASVLMFMTDSPFGMCDGCS
jgi:hypothetical protein